MSNYRRHYVPGGTWFFTVNLQNRQSDLLTRHIDSLRAATGNVDDQELAAFAGTFEMDEAARIKRGLE